MPAGRFRRYKRSKQPRARKKVDRKQNLQIAKIKRALYTKVYTRVGVNGITVGWPATGAPPNLNTPKVYIAPISPAMCQGRFGNDQTRDNQNQPLIHDRLYNWGATAALPVNDWTYSAGTGTNPPSVNPLPTDLWLAGSSLCTKHCKIRYRFQSNSDDSNEVCIAVLQPRRSVADSVIRDTRLKREFGLIGDGACSTAYEPKPLGSQTQLISGTDYTFSGNGVGAPAPDAGTLNTMFGVAFNPQRWKVRYKRYIKMQDTHPQGIGVVTTDMDKNPREVFGSISLPMNTYVRGQVPEPTLVGTSDGTDSTTYATAANMADIQNEDAMLLVVLSSAAIPAQAASSTVNKPIQLDYTQTFTHNLYTTTMKKMS